ncbi:MAG: hypothetical protein ACI8ZH_000519 [Flavobacteriales bacterium]
MLKRFIFATVLIIKKRKMKKNLRNILVLAMGLMTTVSFAQDWNVDSRTRIDMSEANSKAVEGDMMSTSQRATVGATWGGSDWSIHASSDVNYTFTDGTSGVLSAKVYEAYASTDLMGYASVTAGRQALDYGSGAIMSSNQWGANRTSWDGFTFGLNLDMADVTLGYASSTDSISDIDGKSQMWLNAAKAEGDWSANLLYTSSTEGAADAITAMGLDLSYAMMGGDLNLNVSYNTADALDGSDKDMDMTMIGATYNVNETMSISGSQTTYGENGFDVGSASMGGYASSGSLGYLGDNDVNMAIGGAYAMGDFTLGATMNMITNEGDGVTAIEDRDVMDISVGYTMSDNANLSLSMATDTQGENEDNYMWITLNIRP